MHIYSSAKKKEAARFLPPLFVAAIILALFIRGFSGASASAENERRIMTERIIKNALASCYAIEGVYPQRLSYLEEHYGLVIDHDRYVVFYDVLGSNILPSVRVVPAGSGEHNPT